MANYELRRRNLHKIVMICITSDANKWMVTFNTNGYRELASFNAVYQQGMNISHLLCWRKIEDAKTLNKVVLNYKWKNHKNYVKKMRVGISLEAGSNSNKVERVNLKQIKHVTQLKMFLIFLRHIWY